MPGAALREGEAPSEPLLLLPLAPRPHSLVPPSPPSPTSAPFRKPTNLPYHTSTVAADLLPEFGKFFGDQERPNTQRKKGPTQQ